MDNAATSWPKPESVYAAIDHFQRVVGAPAGRGAYKEVIDVLRLIEQTRSQIADFINAPGDRRNIAFTYSGTDSLSTAIMGVLNDGDHVVTSTAEHNSVLRPLRFLEDANRISVSRVDCDLDGYVDARKISEAAQANTKLVALTHVSNVTGAIQPVESVGKFCRENDIIFLLDAAQSLGHIPVDVQAIGCDMLAAPGHKGLLGPLGTGIFYYSNRMGERVQPLRYGGTGTLGGADEQPTDFPDKFESGNLNAPGIAGINAAIEYLQSEEGKACLAEAEECKTLLLAGLQRIAGIKLFGPAEADRRTGVFAFSVDPMACTDAAAALDSAWSIQTRAGLHCAPLLHRTLGTETAGGLVRLSLGLFNTKEQVESAISAISELASEQHV